MISGGGRRFREPELVRLWRSEFGRYSAEIAQRDLIAGLTVAAVALPLALAFGVAGGSTAAAGLVTAIVSGLVIGLLSGAPFQISGPTGAMSAVLIVVAHDYGPRGLWIAGLMAGIMILATGVLKLGRIVNFIPAPVITGFTSGIALVIAIGQIDNFFGIKTEAHDSSASKLAGYFTDPLPSINWTSVLCALIVMATMILLPKLWNTPKVPTALLGVALVTGLSWTLGWDIQTIGSIPRSIVLEDRLVPNRDDLKLLDNLLAPAFAIALLGSIESLLCGVVAGRMTGKKLATNQELIAQGVGNIVLPFFGGVPATAAIARTSVGVKAGGETRMVSVFHSIALLIGMLFFAGAIAHVPMAALAGVLMVTAWRMNEWHTIIFYWRHRLKSAMATLIVTMIATTALDLTQAIIIGLIVSVIVFFWQVSQLSIVVTPVDWDHIASTGEPIPESRPDAQIVTVTGSLFFGSVNQFAEAIERLPFRHALIVSLRGVPMVDVSTIQIIEHVWHSQRKQGGILHLTGLQPSVLRMFERAGLSELIDNRHPFEHIDQALAKAQRDAAAGKSPEDEDECLNEIPFGVATS
ncbi:SulP family inorganic anion transporter [soil metagenome]